MDYLPLFAKLNEQPCLVVGGGTVAARKIELLLEAGASITVVAPELHSAVKAWAEQQRITVKERGFKDEDLQGQLLVIAATSDKELNEQIATGCLTRHTLCNVVDNREASAFIVPAIVDRSPVQIAVSSGGTSPVIATRIRQQLEIMLPQRLGALARWADDWRATVKKHFANTGSDNPNQLRHFWRDILDGPIADRVLKDDTAAANQDMTRALAELDNPDKQATSGEAYIVGAGCGDAGLITLRGAQLLQQADIVLHDRLVSPEVLALARRDADKISVGKKPGSRADSQEEINKLLVQLVAEGKRVCRLKGGDPMIFGRGSEEIQALAAAGLHWQVVPGITAASGAATYAGIPLTHRGVARSVVFVTARDRHDRPPPDWQSLAADEQTIVLYMGVAAAAEIEKGLLAAGKTADTPLAIVENGTTTKQRTTHSTLGDLTNTIAQQSIKAPAVIIIGEVTGLANELSWFATSGDSDDIWSEEAFATIGKNHT